MSFDNTVQNFLKEGKKKETEFAKLLEGAKSSSRNQDINEHWDIKLEREIKIDVKGMKRNRRNGDFDENIHWVELKNVQGKNGWLYGQATHFAFETSSYWVIVEKMSLQRLVSELCKSKERTDNVSDALYKLYSRSGRKDLITKIKTLDLCSIAESMIKKS